MKKLRDLLIEQKLLTSDQYHVIWSSVLQQFEQQLQQATGLSPKIIRVAMKTAGLEAPAQPISQLNSQGLSLVASPHAPQGAPQGVSNVEPVFEPNLVELDAGMVQDFAETLDEARHRAIEATLLELEQAAPQNQKPPAQELLTDQKLADLYRELHTIKGTSRFISAELTEKLIHAAEDLLSSVQRLRAQLEPRVLHEAFGLLLQALDVVWGLRESMREHQSEGGFWGQQQSRDKYLKILTEIQKFHSELSQKEASVALEDVESMF